MDFTLPGTALISSWGGGGGGGGGADGWQTARVCRVPQRVLVVLKSPVQHMEREAGGASQARRIHVVFASENESVESCEISPQQMGPLIRPRVPEATKIRRNEEKKTGFGRPDERLRPAHPALAVSFACDLTDLSG